MINDAWNDAITIEKKLQTQYKDIKSLISLKGFSESSSRGYLQLFRAFQKIN